MKYLKKNEEEEERVENIELEARFVINRIKELIKENFKYGTERKNNIEILNIKI